MAERRMFSKAIINSDAFTEMPVSARLLYYDLGMRADDDGFVNSPKMIMRIVGASQDDLNILAAKKFIIPFDSGVVVIKHWKINNYIRSDRYHGTNYKEEKEMLSFDENGAYTRNAEIPMAVTDGIPAVNQRYTEDRLGKDRLGKEDSIKDTIRNPGGSRGEIQQVIDAWNELPVTHISRVGSGTKRERMLKARLGEYGIDAVLEAINLVSQSPFLLGRVTDFVITFDWFVKPNNFIKVYEGNYSNRQKPDETSRWEVDF